MSILYAIIISNMTGFLLALSFSTFVYTGLNSERTTNFRVFVSSDPCWVGPRLWFIVYMHVGLEGSWCMVCVVGRVVFLSFGLGMFSMGPGASFCVRVWFLGFLHSWSRSLISYLASCENWHSFDVVSILCEFIPIFCHIQCLPRFPC